CIAWLSSAPRSRIETKPAVPPLPHTQRRSVSSHTSPENSAQHHDLAAAAPARKKLPRWQPQCGPQPLTGSASLFALCSHIVKNKERPEPAKKAAPGAPPSHQLPAGLRPRAQCAVSVEESASTAGSVVTEVSVGLAFSSSHSIGSGLRVSARASTSSMRETGTMSRPFLILSLI